MPSSSATNTAAIQRGHADGVAGSSHQHASNQAQQQPHDAQQRLAQKCSGGEQASDGTLGSTAGSAVHSSGDGHNSSGGPGNSSKAAGASVKYDLSILKSSARSSRYGIGSNKSSRINDRLDSLSNLLKARSDVAVLRDLKIGPLLGRGSYGRVYKGEC